jgi:hypothetical protein
MQESCTRIHWQPGTLITPMHSTSPVAALTVSYASQGIAIRGKEPLRAEAPSAP